MDIESSHAKSMKIREILDALSGVAEKLSVPARTLLLEEGKVADRLYLVSKGCLRLFCCDEGKDLTFQFFFEGEFVASQLSRTALCTLRHHAIRLLTRSSAVQQ